MKHINIFSDNPAAGMSWFTDIAGKAENLLNKIDQNAATVLSEQQQLQQQRQNDNHNLTEVISSSSSLSGKKNFNNGCFNDAAYPYGGGGQNSITKANGTTDQNNIQTKRNSTKSKDRDEELIQVRNQVVYGYIYIEIAFNTKWQMIHYTLNMFNNLLFNLEILWCIIKISLKFKSFY